MRTSLKKPKYFLYILLALFTCASVVRIFTHAVENNVCEPNPCQNNGFCYEDSAGAAACDCVGTWFGDKCDQTNDKPTCSDSDGGNDIYEKGTLHTFTPTHGNQVVEEYCVDANRARDPEGTYLEELVCLDNDPEFAAIHEFTKCENGCKDGACIRDAAKPTCSDSDGGDNKYKFGIVEFISPTGIESQHEDYCSSNSTLYEKYCGTDNKYWDSKKIECAYGCKDGACIDDENEGISCSDTDGGYDLYKKGILDVYTPLWGDQIVEEYCVDIQGKKHDEADYVEELVCNDTDPNYAYTHQKRKCEHGCSDGACRTKKVEPDLKKPSTSSEDPDCPKDCTCDSAGWIKECKKAFSYECPWNCKCDKYGQRLKCDENKKSPFDTKPKSEKKSAPSAGFEDEVLTNPVDYQNPFPDTDINTVEGKAASELHRRGVIGGFPDGEFKKDRLVNRAETAKFLLLAKLGEIEDETNNGQFPDVLEGQWYVKFVVTAAKLGIIKGHPDGRFKPADHVNTAEFLKMLSLTFDLTENLPHSYSDVASDAWYAKYAGVAKKYEVFPERDENLEPGRKLTRSEVAVGIYNYLTNR